MKTTSTKKASSSTGKPNLSRRKFIVGSAAAGGGLALGMQLPFDLDVGVAHAATKGAATDIAEINAWVVIRPDDTCVLRVVRSEMGQGTLTGLAQLVAEELECNWKNVTTESPTAGQNYARKRVWGEMGTGGSRGIRTSEDYVRRGGAAARMMLLQAAADEWKVPVSEVSVSEGVITHAAFGSQDDVRQGGGGRLQADAAGRRRASSSRIRRPGPSPASRSSGSTPPTSSTAARSMRSICACPGMLNAAIKQSPVFGGKLVSYDEAKIARMPGVKRVVRVNDSTVAVVADTWWHAKKGLDALPIVWDEGAGATQSSATIAERLQGRSHRDRRICVAQRRRSAESDRRCREESRGGLLARHSSRTRRWSR